MEIREIKLTDYIKYTDFVNQLIKEEETTTLSEEISAEKEKDWLEKKLQNPSNVILVAEENDKIIGEASFLEGDSYDEVADLSLYILADYRHQGIGSQLLRLAIEKMKAKPNPLEMGLDVFEDNVKAMKLYTRFGFVLDKSTRNMYCGKDGRMKKLLRMKYNNE